MHIVDVPDKGMLHIPASTKQETPDFITLLRMGFPCVSAEKESACNTGDLDSIPGFGRSSGEGKGYPLQYSGPQTP